MQKDLIILESPNKVSTVKQIVGSKFDVVASVGHFMSVADTGLYNLGIDINNEFAIDFKVDQKKKDIVKELKKKVENAGLVYICTDPDREGEAIAWHLKEQLKIPAKKLKRCTFTEITKTAVLNALDNPGKIDNKLVDAAFTRTILDKIIGYRLSPIARRKVYCKSVGRCQSAALKLVVEREEEILKFDSKKYYEVWLTFDKNNREYKAQYKGLLKNKKNTTTIDSEIEAKKIVDSCNKGKFIVDSINSSDRVVAPKPPFTTSTFQQEASSKLGYSVKKSQECAQRLFEGINLGGKHVSLVTYLRTDSTEMAQEFQDTLEQFIKTNYGDKYFGGLKKGKKAKNAQEGHECFRVIDLEMTPEKLANYIFDNQLLNVYKLIYNRTVQSMMSGAIITDTEFVIANKPYKFGLIEHAVKFDGWRRVYKDYDDEVLSSGLDVFTNEELNKKDLNAVEKKTSPPKRYSEATLVKKLEDSGVGRPSTYSTIISTILDPGRGYCEEQGKAIAPTEKGITLSHFLDQAFPDIINYDYSAKMEESLDLIANGKIKKLDFLNDFYSKLDKSIKEARKISGEESTKKEVEYVDGIVCPECGSRLVVRNGKFGRFVGCSSYPKCKFTGKL